MSQPRSWIVAIVVAVVVAPSLAHAEKNEIRAVTFDEDSGTTRVHVRGAQTPTFTVYKLERPSRVVIDVPQARLAEALRGHEGAAVLAANTWAVSTVAAQQLDDGGLVTRVIVTLARPGRYDVKTEGNEVVVMVMPRDPPPVLASPEALAQAKAEAARARDSAAAAQSETAEAKATAQAAQVEAERLRNTASTQAAKAEAAQRAADDAKRASEKASAADLSRARQVAAAAAADAARSRQDAVRAQGEADRAKSAADQAMRGAQVEADRARAEAVAAKADAAKSRQDAAHDVDAAQAEAAKAKTELARAKAEVAAARGEADKASAVARANRAEADAAKADLAQKQAEVIAAHREAETAEAQAAAKRAEADLAHADAAKLKDTNARVIADASRARSEADAAKAEATRMRAEADAAHADATAAKAQAALDKQKAEAARGEADQVMRDAKQQLAALDKKAQAAQALDDQARAANAAAQAREEAARTQLAQAQAERQSAEAAARQAIDARDRAAHQAGADRDRVIADAHAAEARLAAAQKATADADRQRLAAETAAANARKDLDSSRTALASVDQQRTAAEGAASEAARKRGEAEAAASDAARRRKDAETAAALATKQQGAAELAASEASKKRGEAEQRQLIAEHERQSAEAAAKAAKQATLAAERQRKVAEDAAGTALAAKRDAEVGLGELSARRTAAERAASELEARSKAEAKAQAEVAAAQARQAGEVELAKARAEVGRLADERKRAEAELADRRHAVSAQQAEADRLKLAANQARDAADREESRRAKLADQRVAEEQALARLAAQKQAPIALAANPPPAAASPRDNLFAAPADKPAPVADKKPAPAPAPAPAGVAQIHAIDFTGDDATGHVHITLAGDPQVTVGEVTATTAELILDHVKLDAKLERKLDVSKFGSPVRAVSSFRDRRTPDRVRVIAELSAPVTPSFDRATGTIQWSFVSPEIARRPVRTKGAPPAQLAQALPPPIGGGFGAASTPIAQQSVSQLPPQGSRRRIYHGQTVELHFKDAPIHDLLRIIADVGKVSIVVPDTIDAKVTLDLKRVPWDQALEVILSSHQLWYRREGNLYRIAPRKELDAEDEAEAARREAALKAESPRAQLVPLNYASAQDLSKKLEPMLSPHGKIAVDPRTNQLIVTDVTGNREQIARLALSLDTQTPQISIEARIVEANSTFTREIGIQWGGNASAGATGGNATGLVFPSLVALAGGNEDANTIRTGVSATPSDFAVNLPAATGSGEGGALGLSLGSVGGNFNINLRLSALEDKGTVRIISAPKVTVLNNKLASIASGVSIPISTVSATGTQTQFVQADLRLEVTPTVSQSDCAISMDVVVQKNEPDFANVGARGDPSILRKEAHTSMLIADGETSVLGGIYTRNSGVSYNQIPLLGDLPVLGWLFKHRRENDNRTEILVFITPKITNRALLRCGTK
jgi:type IV pilus assembly protein PilQ